MFTNGWVRVAMRGIQGEKRMKKLSSMAAMALAAAALAGCGGGGSGSIGFGGGSSSSGGGGGTGTGTTSTYSMGNGSGSSFQSGVIAVSNASLSAGGTTSLQVSIVDQAGTLYTGAAVTITFNSTCISQGLAAVTATGTTQPGSSPDTVTTSTGTANATYTAKGCSGADVISASATVGSASLTATGTLTVAASATGSIDFVSATPTTIGLKGTGLDETSTVIFKVLDSSGAPKAGVSVAFTLDSTVGGMSLSPATATSAADGTVQTVVSSGTVHTPVRVTATIASPALSTQSSQLTVTTGIATSDSFSIAVGSPTYSSNGISNAPACPNVEAWDLDGVVVPITVRLSDRYHNPVLDGTAVAFYTTGGQIVGSCTTAGGACAVNWTSSNPRPLTNSDNPPLLENGRATILATALGEEAFTDNNASGFYQSGDPFQDISEPYADANENGQYDLGEYFLDYNHNGKWDGPSGSFVGITCTGTTPGSTCTSNTLALGAPHLLIMSSSTANIYNVTATGTGGALSGNASGMTVTHGMGGTITFSVSDVNNNPIPAGSTISVSVSSSAGTITGGASYTEPCNTAVGGDTWVSFLTAASTAGSGNITIQITAAGTKSSSILYIPVTVN